MIRKGTRVRFTRDYAYNRYTYNRSNGRVTHPKGTLGTVTFYMAKGCGLVLPDGVKDTGLAVLAFIGRDIERAT